MKTILFTIFSLFSAFAFALPPGQVATLYEHLVEVNPRWQRVKTDAIDFDRKISFKDDIERIRTHLEMVEKILIHTPHVSFTATQLSNRSMLIEILSLYREAKNYPVNKYHTVRRPYFIDHMGTACAVGHLLQKSGQEAFATRISQEMNYAYVMEMPYLEIDQWADANGFTREELALIQPGYQPVVTWSGVGEGADGEITAIYGDETNNRLIVAGNFQSLNGVLCNQVGIYAEGGFSALGDGVTGDIHAIAVFDGKIYLGGSFDQNGNIASWDGSNWSFDRFGYGTVYSLQIYKNALIAGGDFIAGAALSDSLEYIARKTSSSANWSNWVPPHGPVYAMTMHNDELHIGGLLDTTSQSPMYVAKLQSDQWWSAVTNPWERLDNTVRSLTSDGTYLYAVGDCFDDEGNATFGFARLGNSGWERLLNPEFDNLSRYSLKKAIYHEGAILLVGDFQLTPLVGIYGRGIAKFRPNPVFPVLEALAVVDSTINDVASVSGELFIVGAFTHSGGDTVNHIAKTQNLTSIDRDQLVQIGFYPNPLETRAKALIAGSAPISGMEVYDISGKRVKVDFDLAGKELTVFRGDLPSGLYVVKLIASDQVVGQGKIMVK